MKKAFVFLGFAFFLLTFNQYRPPFRLSSQSNVIKAATEAEEPIVRYDKLERVATIYPSGTVVNEVYIELTNITSEDLASIHFYWIGCVDICFVEYVRNPLTNQSLQSSIVYTPEAEQIDIEIFLAVPLSPGDSTTLQYALRKDTQFVENGDSLELRVAGGAAHGRPLEKFDMILNFPEGVEFTNFSPTPVGVTNSSILYNEESLDENDWLDSTTTFSLTNCNPDCVSPFLDIPVRYDYSTSTFDGGAINALRGRLNASNRPNGGLVTAYFDHDIPSGWSPDRNGYVRFWDGIQRPDPSESQCIFGFNCYDTHSGVDFQNMQGNEPVYATANGTVARVCNLNDSRPECNLPDAFGNYVILHHDEYPCYASFYAHLNNATVTEGQSVQHSLNGVRQQIGIMGNTGTKAIHLHFGVFRDCSSSPQWTIDKFVDPFGWDSSEPDPATSVGYPQSEYLWIVPTEEQEALDENGGIANFVTVQVSLPANALAGPTLTTYQSLVSLPSAESNLLSTGKTFRLGYEELTIGAGSKPSTINQPSLPATITIYYGSNIAQQYDENTLSVYHFDEQTGIMTKIPSTVNTSDKTITIQTIKAGIFDVQGEAIYRIYLPIVLK